jgi:transcriptional regulator with XRE-family HTH domain
MKKDLKHEVSLALHRLMFKKKLKQKDLAEMLGVSQALISKWMNEDHNFTLDTIQRIEEVTGEYVIGIML